MERDKYISLGKKIKEVRKSKNISQLDLSIDIDIDRKTISRLENGINKPSLTSLYKISKGLNYDFIKEYIDTSLEEYKIFNSTFDRTLEKIENKLNIDKEIEIFTKISNTTDIDYIRASCQQVLLFLKSLDDSLSYEKKRDLLVKSLNTFEKKDRNFNENTYTDFELRILMNLAMTYIDIDNNKYICILEFIFERSCEEDDIYPIICTNLANAYIYTEKEENCLDLLNKGINYYLNKNMIPNPILYFSRSVYKRQNNLKYIDDYERAILIASLAENKELVDKLKKSKIAYDEWIRSESK